MAFAAALATLGCLGEITDEGGATEGSDRNTRRSSSFASTDPVWDQTPASALRRLSRREFERTLVDTFGVSGLAEAHLPPDVFEPYDTDQQSKDASAVFVEGMQSLSFELGQRMSGDQSWVEGIGDCVPVQPDDADCLGSFIRELGRRLWRRPLSDAEQSGLAEPALEFARERADFYVGVRFVVQALLQSPEFVYQTQVGDPDGDLRELNNFELLSRLSYLIWGTTPTPQLLDRADGEALSDDALVALAEEMLDDPRAAPHTLTFHEQWLGYQDLRVVGALRDPMRQETEALLERVLVEERSPWSELFTSNTTFVNEALASNYEISAAVDGPQWVAYENPQRVGLLSHGSILSLSARNTDDTSPTIRGKYVATRLLCRDIPPPPPNVDVDDPPEGDADTCKWEAYEAHRVQSSSCFGCHELMDPIGFGLERFDGFGRYREVENDNPACVITGEGELAGMGTFSGPRELVDLMVESGELTACGVDQFLQFATGQPQASDDAPALERFRTAFVASGEDFRSLVLAFVADPVFRYRVEESP